MLKFLRQIFTYANVVSMVAMSLAVGSGLAIAGSSTPNAKKVEYTGKEVKNNTLTGDDFKNESIDSSDFDASALTSITSDTSLTGPTGETGDKGARGNKGTFGDQGDPGIDYKKAYTFSKDDTGRLKNKSTQPPNLYSCPWNNDYTLDGGVYYDCVGPSTTISCVAPIPTNCKYNSGNVLTTGDEIVLDQGGQDVLRLTSGDANDGYLTLNEPSDVLVFASMTLWHSGTVHSRAECYAQAKNANLGDSGYTDIGSRVFVSTTEDDQLISLNVVAGTKFEASAFTVNPTQPTIPPDHVKPYYLPLEIAVRIRCRGVDQGNLQVNDWRFIKGNLQVLSAKEI